MAKRSGRLEPVVEMPSQLGADLSALTDALDPPRTDLALQLSALIAEIRMTNDSYLGLSLTIVVGGTPFVLLALDDAVDRATILASAYLPLPALCDVEPDSSIIFYAADVDAFVEFAIEVTAALQLVDGTVELDGHRTPPPTTSGPTTVAAAMATNQAIGILIERGSSPEEARAELHARTRRTGDPHSAAVEVLSSRLDDGSDGS